MNATPPSSLKFVDLFAGLGGFNLALTSIGHRCVFASEVERDLRECYAKNFGIKPSGDLRKIARWAIPDHDILCAGFPCQPFSKAGEQEGLNHPQLGELYRQIIKVIREHRPRYLILENVPNLVRHDAGKTWATIEGRLRGLGYSLEKQMMSPHEFGVPQIRERVYVVGLYGESLSGFKWPAKTPVVGEESLRGILDGKRADARALPANASGCIALWQDFLDRVPAEERLPHPVWAMEFGATYPFESRAPFDRPLTDLQHYSGSFGRRLRFAKTKREAMSWLPSHARRNEGRFPSWKIRFIENNRAFFKKHRAELADWLPKAAAYPSSYQKLEWNCKGEARDLRKFILQLRASGLRVKRPTTAPSLVAMTSTQLPIVGWEMRYMTLEECKKLQSMEKLGSLPESLERACEALGNAVNVRVATLVADALINRSPQPSRGSSRGRLDERASTSPGGAAVSA